MQEGSGTVEAIFIAGKHGEMPHLVPQVAAHAGKGLEGDRNFGGADPEECQITLIEAEAFERLRDEFELDLDPTASRRQVLVRGADLGGLIGQRFSIGEVECAGEERCEPCNHLVSMVETKVVLRGLLHTGLRASIVTSGTIRTGDVVRVHI